jgi:hypothetical protein
MYKAELSLDGEMKQKAPSLCFILPLLRAHTFLRNDLKGGHQLRVGLPVM